MAMNLEPHPIVVSQVCSLCGLDWPRHGDSPTGKTCIDLLKADLQTARVQLAHRPFVQPIPYAPYPHIPWGRQLGSGWAGTIYGAPLITTTNGTGRNALQPRSGTAGFQSPVTPRTI